MVPVPVAAELRAALAAIKPSFYLTKEEQDFPTPPSRRHLEDVLFDICSGCHHRAQGDATTMSAIPQGVLAVRAIAANRAKKTEAARAEIAFEHPPLKYNSKLMNSIWGLYNRYSVHNFKKNTDGESAAIFGFGSQQQMLIASAAAPISGALVDSFCIQ